jgi:hypothetical protein
MWFDIICHTHIDHLRFGWVKFFALDLKKYAFMGITRRAYSPNGDIICLAKYPVDKFLANYWGRVIA